ncbi:MAG TPA: hypothetical protein VHO06_01765 [Polyangia bacterium]|nr:hypothetical protein [Polyangia bacterium]
MIPLHLVAPLLLVTAQAAAEPPPVASSPWTVRDQLQLPAMAANHVVGGVGGGVELQKGVFALDAEAQILFVAICDSSCGPAYAGGVGVSATPGRWGDVTSHLSLLAEYFVHPGLHQSLPALSPRAGLRWLSGGTGVSLDAGLTLTAAGNFDAGGFARNKVLGWAMPALVMGIWF